MKALNHFVVRVDKVFNDTMEVGDKSIYLDNKWNEFEHRICHGVIVSPPTRHDTGAKAGDTLFFHHHVTTTDNLRIYDNMYVASYGGWKPHAIAYRRKKDGEIVMLGNWIFVEPAEIDKTDQVTGSGIVTQLSHNIKDRDVAKVMVPTDYMKEQGVESGDIVGFSADADYKMVLDDGSVVYRMVEDNIMYVEEN